MHRRALMLLLAAGLLLGLVAPAEAPAREMVARPVATVHVAVQPLAAQQASTTATRWAKKSSVKTRYGASSTAKYRRTVRIGYRFTIDVSVSTSGWWKVKNRQEWVAKKDVTSSEKSLWPRKDYARLQAWRMINATKGWNVNKQYPCIYQLVKHESGWNRHAGSPYDVYGLPQALPGSKMASAGSNWRHDPNVQLRWLLKKYIPDRYDTPCGAWRFFQRNNWY